MRIGIIGCGHMGSAIANALASQGKWQISASNPVEPRVDLKPSARAFFTWTQDNTAVAKNADVIFLAVKPSAVSTVIAEIQPHLKDQIIISIAAGISLAGLQKFTKNYKKIVRVMPNLAAQICEGVSVWKSTKILSQSEKKLVKNLLACFGTELEVANENLINIATAVSGGAPAYIAAYLESLQNVCEKTGYRHETARALAIKATLGSIKYIEKTGADFSEIKNAVQTKGGTTEAGFKVLKKHAWQKTLEKALMSGAARAREISESN